MVGARLSNWPVVQLVTLAHTVSAGTVHGCARYSFAAQRRQYWQLVSVLVRQAASIHVSPATHTVHGAQTVLPLTPQARVMYDPLAHLLHSSQIVSAVSEQAATVRPPVGQTKQSSQTASFVGVGRTPWYCVAVQTVVSAHWRSDVAVRACVSCSDPAHAVDAAHTRCVVAVGGRVSYAVARQGATAMQVRSAAADPALVSNCSAGSTRPLVGTHARPSAPVPCATTPGIPTHEGRHAPPWR